MRAIVAVLLFWISLFAAQKGACDLDCYRYAGLGDQRKDPEQAIFILIDKTTYFDSHLREQAREFLSNRLTPGTRVYIAQFSAFIDHYYNKPVLDFTIEPIFSEKEAYDISKRKLRRFKQCLIYKLRKCAKTAYDAMERTYLQEGESIAKSDILFALRNFSRNTIAKAKAKRKIVLILSDMLENSAITSFYHRGHLRRIDPQKELEKVEKEGLFGDFAQASVYVIGTGVVTLGGKNVNGYKDSVSLLRLERFWKEYFKRSNAAKVLIGEPALLESDL